MSPVFKRIVFIFIIIFLFTPLKTYCKCDLPNMEKAMIEASEIFIGTLLSKKYEESSKLIKYEFNVEKRWKGPANKTVTVWTDRNDEDAAIVGDEGETLLVIAYLRDGLLKTSSCSAVPPDFNLGFSYFIYDIPYEEILDTLSLLTIEQIKHLDGGIEAKIIKLGNKEIDAYIDKYYESNTDWKMNYKIVELNKGKKHGLYRGMEMCFSIKSRIPIKVIDVKEESATAVIAYEGFKDEERINPLGKTVKSTIGWCN